MRAIASDEGSTYAGACAPPKAMLGSSDTSDSTSCSAVGEMATKSSTSLSLSRIECSIHPLSLAVAASALALLDSAALTIERARQLF